MDRRRFLAALGGVGVVSTAGCSTLAGDETLSDPTVDRESSGRQTLRFTSGDKEVGTFGADGRVSGDLIDLPTEIWHRDGTKVASIRLRAWMPETAGEFAADVAVVSPVEGDSSPPPSVALYTPDRGYGTVVEVTDLDDLADETISTLALLVRPASETATTLNLDATIDLTGNGLLDTDYTLRGQLQLEFPELATA